MERHILKNYQKNNVIDDSIANRVEKIKFDNLLNNKLRLNFSLPVIVKASLITFFGIILFTSMIFFIKRYIDANQPFPNYIYSEKVEFGLSPYLIDSGLQFEEVRTSYTPVEKHPQDIINSLSGDVVYAYDPDSLLVYASKNIDKKVHIASITKLVSVLVIRERYKLDDKITLTGKYFDWENVLGVVNGDQITVEDGLKVMLIASKNDIAEEFAEIYPNGGYEGFVKRMNEIALEIGMKDSVFDSASGLWEGENYSTAYDLRLLVGKILGDQFLVKLVGESNDSVDVYKQNGRVVNIPIASTNFLLGNVDGAKGLKTGYTKLAGQCLIGYFEFENKSENIPRNAMNKSRLVTIVLSSVDRFGDTKMLVR